MFAPAAALALVITKPDDFASCTILKKDMPFPNEFWNVMKHPFLLANIARSYLTFNFLPMKRYNIETVKVTLLEF
jgi:hypothetical protein